MFQDICELKVLFRIFVASLSEMVSFFCEFGGTVQSSSFWFQRLFLGILATSKVGVSASFASSMVLLILSVFFARSMVFSGFVPLSLVSLPLVPRF